MNYKKTILILLFIIMLFIGIISISLILISLKENNNDNDFEAVAYEDTYKVINTKTFYKVNNCINQYIKSIKEKNQEAYMSINKDTKMDKEINSIAYFYSQEMYEIDKVTNVTVFVKGYLRQRTIEEEQYYVVNIDYNNTAFEIRYCTAQEYQDAIDNQVKQEYKEDIVINQNEYNKIENKEITDLFILQTYFEDFKYKEINKIDQAFQQIDEEYKKLKFNNDINEFKQFVQKNIEVIESANILKNGINQIDDKKEYIGIDNYNNYYKFIVTGINEYTVILDNYTIETDELKQKYSKLSDEEKAISNIDKVMKLINTKDYATVYQYLNQSFKETNFTNIELFEKYMQETFFDNNIVGNIGIRKEENVYILSVPYKESLSTAAEEKEKNFIMRLGEGTNFELSFEM